MGKKDTNKSSTQYFFTIFVYAECNLNKRTDIEHLSRALNKSEQQLYSTLRVSDEFVHEKIDPNEQTNESARSSSHYYI